MDWQEVVIQTEKEAVEAVAEVFHLLGSGGVVIEDPELIQYMTKSGQWDAYELPEVLIESTVYLVKGYFPLDQRLPARLEGLKSELDAIRLRLGHTPYEAAFAVINEEDWANSWKAYFKPIKIGDRIVVRPTWEEYTPDEGEIVLDIDPGMAFGIGSHASTAMCVRLLEKYVGDGDYVIDVGTGTGILSMSAVRLGAKGVLALDYDDTAVKVARENVCLNQLDGIIDVRCNDLLNGLAKKADLITANITADIIKRLMPQVKGCLKPGGKFITSGIIVEREPEIKKVGTDLGFVLLEELIQEGWVACVWQLKEY